MATFLEILNEATAIVAVAYPGSRLYEADGGSSQGLAFDESDVDTWRFRFLGPMQANQATTVVLEYRAPHFRAPILERESIHSDVIIKIGLDQAIALKNEAGNREPFKRVCLRWPIPPSDEEPFYLFGSNGTPFVFVGNRTGAVTTLGARSLVGPH
jgi:hypothetical protein